MPIFYKNFVFHCFIRHNFALIKYTSTSLVSRGIQSRKVKSIYHLFVQDAFEKFKAQVIADQSKAEEEHKVAIAKLSKEAQEADKKLLAISSDKSLKQKEKDVKIQEIFSCKLYKKNLLSYKRIRICC